ncbi:alkanesulfonate monooxygenase SsuD/methylene tetrahydromethanopterin reductase-like flavin-dependent oxidoreductase (luciferase family) [Bradyrhizobium sp. i1.4.4]
MIATAPISAGSAEAKTRSASSTRKTRAIFGRSYAAEPEALIEQLRQDEAIAEADTLLLTIPNQLGVDYCAHAIEAILKHVAPALGWR